MTQKKEGRVCYISSKRGGKRDKREPIRSRLVGAGKEEKPRGKGEFCGH